jgi:transitional endoplasmic reticulum ATPase
LNDIESTLKAYRRTLTQIANVLNEQQRNAKLNKNQQTPLEDAKPNTSIKAYEKNHLSSNITFSSIAGLHEAKQAFENKIILPFKHPEIFNKYRVKKGGGILLYGLPGTGKTMFAQAAANEISAKFYSIKCSDIMNEYYGKSEANIREVFNEARKNPVSIIFFDEFEALAAKRRESQHYSPTTAQEILAQMQGFEKNQNQTLLVIAATNCP